MRPPCEIVAQELLPLIRGYIAHDLNKRMTQQEVAERMGISQPTVSSYLKSFTRLQESGETYLENESVKNLVIKISQMVQTNQSAEEIIRNICSTCVSLRVSGETCRKHIASYPKISQGCAGCLPVADRTLVDNRQEVLRQLDDAVNIIENNLDFAKIMPQVRINICQSIGNPDTIDDVAAIPGRMTMVRGRVRALLPPEFGVSQHTAKLLMKLNSINQQMQSIICIKYNEEIFAIIKQLNLEFKMLSNEIFNKIENLSREDLKKENTDLLSFLEKLGNETVSAIINQGAMGIEPIVYLVSNSVKNLVRLCQDITSKL
ncbi:MAG: winged helix-turn-helix transcriptional regulator [Asgard group archaeon]|nr:winged helix-turn-helix transcriptional regulator [Asgard group archaeon]